MVHNVTLSQTTVAAAAAITTSAVIFATYYYNKIRKNEKIPTEWTAIGKVSELNLYPLKGGKKRKLQEVECTKRGFIEMDRFDGSLRLRDRCFVTYKPENLEFRVGTHFPQMVLISVRSCENTAIFEAPNMAPLVVEIPQNTSKNVVKVKQVRGEIIESIDCGDKAAAWISKYLQNKDSGLRLAYHDGTFKRTQINALYKDLNDFYKREFRNESAGLNSNKTAVMLVNEASSKDVIDRLDDSEVSSDNFRANIIVSGCQSYAEDDWKWIKIGDVVMKNVIDCIRCSMTTINPETGVRRKDFQPLKMLTKCHGIGPKDQPVMGICLEVFQTGTFSIGDTVHISK